MQEDTQLDMWIDGGSRMKMKFQTLSAGSFLRNEALPMTKYQTSAVQTLLGEMIYSSPGVHRSFSGDVFRCGGAAGSSRGIWRLP
jgi:hypothetical protein